MQIHPPLSSVYSPLSFVTRRCLGTLSPIDTDTMEADACDSNAKSGGPRHDDGIISVRGYKIPDCPVAQRDRASGSRYSTNVFSVSYVNDQQDDVRFFENTSLTRYDLIGTIERV